MEKGVLKFIEKQNDAEDRDNGLVWAWKNQPPVMRWWFAFSTISLMAVYYVLMIKL